MAGSNVDGNVKFQLNVAGGAVVADFVGQLWQSDGDYELIDAAERHSVAGAAANIQVFKVTSGQAKASGVTMLSSAGFDATATADVTRVLGPSATLANARLVRGDSVAVFTSAASAALAGVSVTVRLKALAL